MPAVSSSSSYDAIPDFGALYDSVPLYVQRGDVPFYVEEAKRAGSVLEIGSGTGRVLLPIAQAGVTITGLDGSEQMLARCRAKLQSESEDTRARVSLQKGDARSFDLGETFPLVIAPFRVLQQLVTIDEQLNCLASIRRHVAPGGRFIFDVFNPAFSLLVQDRSRETEDTPPVTLPDGRVMRRAYRIERVRWIDQVSESELIYYVAPNRDAQPERFVQRFEMRWYQRAELIHLLARSGFQMETIYGGFDHSELTDRSPEQVVVAQKI
jgi:SAM-dependent methyltransferase